MDLDSAEIDWEKLADQVRPQAERMVHDQLLLDAVAEAEKLRLDEKEFERMLSALAAPQKLTSLALRQQLSESGRLEGLRSQMLREQTVRFLLGEKPPGADEAEEEAEDGAEPEDAGGAEGGETTESETAT